MKKQPILIMPVGIPGSGKSTYSKAMSGYVRLSGDDTMVELFGTQQPKDPSWFGQVYDLVHKRLEENLAAGKNVILDATNCNSKSWPKPLEIARRHNAKVIAVLFDVPKEICLARNDNRDDEIKVPVHVIESMNWRLDQFKNEIPKWVDEMQVVKFVS